MKKIALIIGNAQYVGQTSNLDNPSNDADSIEDTFNRLGIHTIKKINIAVTDFKDQLDDFRSRLVDYEAALFFFAGHGLQIEGENYLCATDTDFANENRVKYSAVALNYIIEVMNKSSVYVKLIILDACRDNPFDTAHRSLYRRGLAPIYAPIGTLIAFATSPGQLASDGKGKNGAFTYSLLHHINTLDIKVEEVFKRTRHTLFSFTNGKQVSWEHTSLMGDFYFSTSQLSGDFQKNYSVTALQDSNYDYTQTSNAIQIVIKLRSHNWDTQNIGIKAINGTDFSSSSKDDLFILGRNIYQTACSNSWNADDYMKNLKTNLMYLDIEVRYHVLNGMAYEIYFNNQGKLRDEFKTGRISEVINLLMDPDFKQSAAFINEQLLPYDFKVIFKFILSTSLSIDILCEKIKDDFYAIKEISIDGKNKLYNYDGASFYEINDNILSLSKEKIIDEISQKIAAPLSKLVVIFNGVPDDIDKVGCPYEYKLLNYQIKTENE